MDDPTRLVANPTWLEANPTRLVVYQSRLVVNPTNKKNLLKCVFGLIFKSFIRSLRVE